MRIFAVCGNPVLHSSSPFIFNSLLKKEKLRAVYTRLLAGSAEEAFFLFREIGFKGMNITSPFKKEVIPFLDDIDETASLVGAVNTVVEKGNFLYGYNTDYSAVMSVFRKRNVAIEGKRCAVIGAGGAGRAAFFALLKSGAEVTILNRDYKKALSLVKGTEGRCEPVEKIDDVIGASDIIVSALPPEADLIDAGFINEGHVILDANYRESKIQRKAISCGAMFIDGREWLVEQALKGYERFFEKQPDEKVMRNNVGSTVEQDSKNISLIGIMGSGKSSVAEALSKKTCRDVFDTDREIEREEGTPVCDIFRDKGEEYFRKIEKKRILELQEKERTVCASGGGSPLDAQNRDVIRKNSISVWLYVSPEEAIKRLEEEKNGINKRPLLKNEPAGEGLKKILKERFDVYSQTADVIINTENKSPLEVADLIYEEVNQTFKNFWEN